jgi:REP element-mobilizing transposase RayT
MGQTSKKITRRTNRIIPIQACPIFKFIESKVNMKTQLRKAAHAVFRIQFHIIFVTKYRKNAINQAILSKLEEVFSRVCEKRKCQLLKFNGENNSLTSPPCLRLRKGNYAIRLKLTNNNQQQYCSDKTNQLTFKSTRDAIYRVWYNPKIMTKNPIPCSIATNRQQPRINRFKRLHGEVKFTILMQPNVKMEMFKFFLLTDQFSCLA